MRKALDYLEMVVLGISAVILLVVAVVLLLQVYFRYVMGVSTPWASEIARYGMVWLTIICLGVIARHKSEIRVDFLEHFVKNDRFLNSLALLFRLLEISFMIVLVLSGLRLRPIAGTQRLIGLGLPMTVVINAFVIGPFLVLPFLFESLVDTLLAVGRRSNGSTKNRGAL